MVSAEIVDIGGMAEMVEICEQGALASLAVAVHNSHCTLVSAYDSAVLVVVSVAELADKNHLMDALSNEHYAFAASHSSLDKPFVAPK